MIFRISSHQARLGMATAALVGLFASAYLLYAYVTGAPIICGSVSGCELVRASRWAYTFGIPRPLLGVIFYAAVFALLIIRSAVAWRLRFMGRLTKVFASLGFIESAFLFFVQWLDIRAFCLWCLASAVAATIIFLLCWFDSAHYERAATADLELREYFICLLAFLPISFFGLLWLTGR